MNLIDKNEYNLKEISENKNFINLKKKAEPKKTDMDEKLLVVCIDVIQNNIEKYLTEAGGDNIDVILKKLNLDLCEKY